MKSLLFALLALFFFACQPAAEQPAAEAPPAEAEADANLEAFKTNSKAVRQYLDHFINKDMEAMMAMMTDDFFMSPPEWGMDSLNTEQWQEREQYFMDNYSDITFEEDQYYAGLNDEDQTPNGDVRVYGNWHFTYNGNNQRGAMKFYGVFFFNEEGKITGVMEWFNTADLVPKDAES